MAFITKRPNGVYYIVWTDSTGRQRYRSTKTKARREAERRLKYFLDRQDSGEWAEARTNRKNPTPEEFREAYVRWAAQYHTRKTMESQLGRWDRFIAWRKPKRLGDVTRDDIRAFIDFMKSVPGPRGRVVSNTTANNFLRDLKAIFGHAIADLEMLSPPNPVVGIKRLRVEENHPPYLDPDEVQRLVRAAKAHSPALYLWCLVGLYCGLRFGEAAELRWEYFSWDEKLLRLPSPEHKTLKSHKSRAIPLPDTLIAILRPLSRESGYVFEGRADNRGRHHYRYDPKKGFARVVSQAGLADKGVTYHHLRHTYATLQTLNGTPTAILKEWMGHASETTTARYQHVLGYRPDVNNFAPILDRDNVDKHEEVAAKSD